MIPAAFEYHRPQDMAGVLAVLEEHGDDARVMAGGHSLIPMMKLRMADVPHLIDLQDVGGNSNDMLDMHRPAIEETLLNLQEATRNLREFSRILADQPDALIRGKGAQGRKDGEGK